jgi:hypothetical protein
MKINYRCSYCGLEFEWENTGAMYLSPTCTHCGDENLEFVKKDLSKGDVFHYNDNEPMTDAYFKVRK